MYRRTVERKPVVALYSSSDNPGLVVVDTENGGKENGGKADALNAGMNIASGDLACAIDADTLIEADALLRMVAPFLTGDDVVATGGTIRVANGASVGAGRVLEARVPHQALAGIQAGLGPERGWLHRGHRRGGHGAGGPPSPPRARPRPSSPGRVRRRPCGVDRGPVLDEGSGSQRDRWHRGLSDVVWRSRGLFFNPRYGSLALVVFPCYVIVELLAPVVDRSEAPGPQV